MEQTLKYDLITKLVGDKEKNKAFRFTPSIRGLIEFDDDLYNDMMQSTFLRIMEYKGNIENYSHLCSLFIRILFTNIIDYKKKYRKRLTRENIIREYVERLEEPVDKNIVELYYDDNEKTNTEARLFLLTHLLPVDLQNMIHLKFNENWPLIKIAKEMEIPIHVAKRKLDAIFSFYRDGLKGKVVPDNYFNDYFNVKHIRCNGARKVARQVAIEIQEKFKTGMWSVKDIIREYKLSKVTVYRIKNNKYYPN